jgi:archaeal preflagellin peptidase FlaK
MRATGTKCEIDSLQSTEICVKVSSSTILGPDHLAKLLKFRGRYSCGEDRDLMESLALVELAAILVSIFFFSLSSIFDIRTREVEDWVWQAYGPVGLALTVFRLFLDPSMLFLTLASIALTTLLSLALFYFGMYGGADAKAVICLGLTLPLIPTGFNSLLGYVHPFFPVVALIMGYLCSASLTVWFGLGNLFTYMTRGKSMFEGLEGEAWTKKILAAVLGYPTDLTKLQNAFYLYPMEEVTTEDDRPRRTFRLYQNAETDRDPVVSRLSDSLTKLGFKGKVWVTPGLPMLFFILIGIIITLAFGDVIFSTVFILARR